MTFGLVQRVAHGTPREVDDARQALARIGSRAVKPLLDALADPDVSQQRIAVDVLAYVQNRNAALPLFAFATGSAEPALRVRAMIACGALADATLVPKYEALLFPKDALGDPSGAADAVGVAAVWGLARMGDARGLPVLRRVARTGTAPMRALAVLGLGRAHDGASAAEIAEIARAVDAGALTRAAAAYALGELNAQAFAPALIEIAEDGEMLPRRMALVALARMARTGAAKGPDWKREAVQAMADAVFVGRSDATLGRDTSEALAGTAVAALSILAAGHNALDVRVPGRARRRLHAGRSTSRPPGPSTSTLSSTVLRRATRPRPRARRRSCCSRSPFSGPRSRRCARRGRAPRP